MQVKKLTKILLIKIIVLVLTISNAEAFFGKALKKIKDKATRLYKSKYGKDKTWHFLGHDLSEYPGSNEKYRNINRDKWTDYYKCLNEQNANLGKFLSVTPEAILGFEGSSVKLDCKVCLSPPEKQKVDSVQWDWAAESGKHLEPVEFTEHIVESPVDKTLHLYNLQMENTGQYVCHLGDALTAPYFLTVTSIPDTEMVEVHSTEVPLGPYPKEPEVLQGFNLIVDTEWGEWSICSKCDQIGRKHKIGYCIVYSENYQDQKLTPASNETNGTISNTEKLINDIDLELFNIFKFGIPCSSHILPKAVQEHAQVKNRKNEIMTGYCKVKCPKNEVFEVKDRNGKVIEKANNSAGIYSLMQSLPPLEPPIERRLQYEAKGKKIVLVCPGNVNSDAPIHWLIGNKNLIPELISKQSKGRIYISITDRIHISEARLSDSSIYSCWQQNELAGTIRLVIEKKFEMNFNHHIMLLGIIIILATFLYVGVKAFVGKKYAKT